MDDESGESMQQNDVTGVGRGESELDVDWDEVMKKLKTTRNVGRCRT